ncbi:MAG: hypothetical protein QOE40_2450 [Actinomycetota bacterium]|nr:hypothetical protein [Actinomycetota bacterium]
MSDVEALREATEGLHRRVSEWAAAVIGVAEESDGDSTDALSDPRLEAAQDSFYESLADFEESTLPVLGLVPQEQPVDSDAALALTADDFFLHFVVGVPEDAPSPRLDDAFEIVHQAGHDAAERLMDAGFEVPTFAASRGELDLGGLDGEDDT